MLNALEEMKALKELQAKRVARAKVYCKPAIVERETKLLDKLEAYIAKFEKHYG